jgi:hypothetical protein
MSTSLFHPPAPDPLQEIEQKVASGEYTMGFRHRVDGPPDTWGPQVMEAMALQYPFLLNLPLGLKLLRTDESGYGIGILKAEKGVGPNQVGIIIPFIIRDGELLEPIVFIHDRKVYPLTENRLLGAFQGNSMGVASKDRDSVSSMDDLGQSVLPPDHSSGMGYGNRAIMGKLSCVRQSDLDQILKIAQDFPELSAQIHGALEKVPRVSEDQLKEVEKQAQQRLPLGGHLALQADPKRFGQARMTFLDDHLEVQHRSTKLASLYDRLSPESSQTLQQGDPLFLGNPGESAPPPTLRPEAQAQAARIEAPGTYMVFGVDGKARVGSAFTRVVSFHNVNLPLVIFSNGEETAMQEEIAGEPAHEGTSLPAVSLGEAVSQGVEVAFRIPNPTREQTAMILGENLETFDLSVPFVVRQVIPDVEGEIWIVESALGEDAQLRPGQVSTFASMGSNQFLFPSSWDLVQLGPPDQRFEAIKTSEGVKVAHQDAQGDRVVVRAASEWGPFSIQSFCPDFRGKWEGLNKTAAVLYLTSFGADNPQSVLQKAARSERPVTLRGKISQVVRQLKTAHEMTRAERDLQQKLATYLGVLRPPPEVLVWSAEVLRRSPREIHVGEFFKEAFSSSSLPDAGTPDDVLGLGFVRPENTANYVSNLDTLEDAAQALASLVLAGQLGYSEVPLSAAKTAMRSIERVLVGLRSLSALSQVD